MKKLFDLLKARFESYVGIAIIIVVVVLKLTDVEDSVLVKVKEVDRKVEANNMEIKAVVLV